MPNFIDLTGQKFNRLTVIERIANSDSGRIRWRCKCDCGGETITQSYCLRSGHTRSCGCLQREAVGNNSFRFIDLMGQTFGRLTVIKLTSKDKRGAVRWICQCECGNTAVVATGNLRRGITKSCGCLSKLPFGEASFNLLYTHYKDAAASRNRKFSLTKEEFRKLTKQECYYCGVAPKQKQKTGNHTGEYIYNGLDRYDNDLGYTTENSVTCCWGCNRFKSTMHGNEFLTLINKIQHTRPLEEKRSSLLYSFTCS